MNTVIIMIIDICLAFVIGDQISDWTCIRATSIIHPFIPSLTQFYLALFWDYLVMQLTMWY